MVRIAQKVPQKAILVLDFSSSMNDAANGRPVSYWNPSKLSTLKSAVNSFLTEYFKANEDNEVMIITYGNSATRDTNEVAVLGKGFTIDFGKGIVGEIVSN